MLDEAIAIAEYAPRTPWRRHMAIWLTVDEVEIGRRRWRAARSETRGHGYTLRQARQMREALLPVMKAEQDKLRAAIHTHLQLINGYDR
ncbi:hypothetical protein [Microbispora sp. NPDC049125]|uniref:hypothetical protein n=1 Tax=Microbispora sp. NPDC049125 TaxID=3154929 RepID=UPI003466441E